VYFNDNSRKKFIETDKLGGADPYSASKVATESAVDAWAKISEINSGPLIFSCRAGNIIGGGDLSPNRLLSDLVKNKYFSIPREIRNPKSTRPWQYVLDPLYGYVLALENSISSNKATSYNFGPEGKSLSVSEVIQIFELKTGNEMPLVYRNDGIFYESEFLELNSTKALRELGWRAKISQKKAVELTVSWWEKVFNDLNSAESECLSEIEIYLSLNDES
jgi:CDP-glucose 4,6-dehydratase